MIDKSDPMTTEDIERIKAQIEDGTYEDFGFDASRFIATIEVMHPSVVHDCCVAVEQVRKLADTIEAEIAPFTKPGDRTVADRIRAALVVKS